MLRALISLTLAGLLAACTSMPMSSSPGETQVRNGRITAIQQITIEGDQKIGLGAVLGAVAGGVLGHQIGGGTGQDIATVAGAVAGGYAGQKVENKYKGQPGQHITVRLDNGQSVAVTQPLDSMLHVGDRVRIEGSGDDARVRR